LAITILQILPGVNSGSVIVVFSITLQTPLNIPPTGQAVAGMAYPPTFLGQMWQSPMVITIFPLFSSIEADGSISIALLSSFQISL